MVLRLERSDFAIHGMHNRGCQNHLRYRVRQTSNSSGLTEKVAPPNDPGPGRNVLRRYNVFRDVVHSASCRICGHQFGHLEVCQYRTDTVFGGTHLSLLCSTP